MTIEIPEGWVSCEIGKVAIIVSGSTPPSKDLTNFTTEGGIPWITPADLSGYKDIYISRGVRNLTEKGFAACSAPKIPPGSVLFSSRAPVGYVAISLNEVTTNQGFKSFVLPEGLDSRFVYFYLRHIKPIAEIMATGTTFKELSGSSAARLPLVIAPFNEQKRIADKLDALLARVDASRERLDRIPLILKRFRQAVLAAATSGQFTEDWREENFDIEPATNLVKQKRFTLAASDDNLPLLPDNWEWVALGNYAQCSRGRFSVRPRNDPAYFNGEHPFIQIGNLPSEGGWITAHKQTLNEKGLAVSKKFPKGTVVIAIVGATIGNTGILAYDMCFTDSMVGIDSGDEISNRYIELFLRHRKEEIRQTSYAGGGQPNIKLEVLNPYPLALPPLAEQHEIVCRVEVLFAYADRLEARYQAARTQVDRLTPALLTKAFRGELVPQDPNDEPASVLLERIRAQRAAQPAKPKRSQASRKPTMTKMTEESVKEAISQLPKDKFSFDELRENIPGDYDSLKDILFALLSEAEPSLKQVFDQEEQTMRFVRAGK